MGQISSKLRNVQGGGLTYWCQGCEQQHTVYHGAGERPRWGWNGNVDRPTFTPSVFIRVGHYAPSAQLRPDGKCHWCEEAAAEGYKSLCSVCHTYITDGVVKFLSDCTHALAGQTLPLPDLPEHMRDAPSPG